MKRARGEEGGDGAGRGGRARAPPPPKPADSENAAGRFVRVRELPPEVVASLEKKSIADRSPWALLPSDVIAAFARRLRSPDLRAFAQCCARWCLVARPLLNEMLEHDSFDPVHLSEDQLAVYEAAVLRRESVFVSGVAGTGKSHTLRVLRYHLEQIDKPHPQEDGEDLDVVSYDKLAVVACAPTNIAAQNVGGVTVHALCGTGLRVLNLKQLQKQQKAPLCEVARSADVLFLDEVSMVDAERFDYLDLCMRVYRNRLGDPFGGLQLIVTGDVLQLPPVNKDKDRKPTRYAFESAAWDRVFGRGAARRCYALTRTFRQAQDLRFFDALNRVRTGKVDAETRRFFESRHVSRLPPLTPEELEEYVTLTPTCREADDINEARLRSRSERTKEKLHAWRELRADLAQRPSEPTSEAAKAARDRMRENIAAPEVVRLCVGARVMLRRNCRPSGVYNSHQGRVVAVLNLARPEEALQLLRRERAAGGGKVRVLRDYQHDADYQRFERALAAALDPPEDEPTGYLAGRLMDDFCTAVESAASSTDSKLLASCFLGAVLIAKAERILGGCNTPIAEAARRCAHALPVVRFDARPDAVFVVPPFAFAAGETRLEKKFEGAGVRYVTKLDSHVEVFQLPIVPAYAITAHRAQGLTLPRVVVSLARCFEPGQAYVALSRATRAATLRISSMPPWERVVVPEKLAAFDASLQRK